MIKDDLPPLREVVATFGLAAKKSLGQNFLFDLNLTGRIARAAGPLDQGTTIEVGPGPGGLTRALLAEGATRLIAIEKDQRCLEAQAQIAEAYPGRLEIREGDALDLSLHELGPSDEPRRVVANLPYNVATPLLIGWLKNAQAFESFTLMFQKEVADRLSAAPGGKTYGRLSVLAQWLCQVEPLFDLNPKAFHPPPKVTSTVVQLIPRRAPEAADFALMEKVTAAAFGQRRKMLRASLKSLGDPLALCEAAGVEPTARAETIPVEAFCAMARQIKGETRAP